MARTPVGTIHKPQSDTALFAHIAWRLEGERVKDLGAWIGGLGIDVGATAIRNAPKTARRLASVPNGERCVRPSVLVDCAALDLFTALVTLRSRSRRDALLPKLEDIHGVLELLTVEDADELFALVVYERRSDKLKLRSMLGEFADVLQWREIEERRSGAAVSTFRALAREAAAREQLTGPPQAKTPTHRDHPPP